MFRVLDHPLAAHLLTRLRDRATDAHAYRELAAQLTVLLVLEATRDLPLRPVRIETPLEPATGAELAQPLVAVPILRAGLALLEPVVRLFPRVDVGYIGLERSHDGEARARTYYAKLPELRGKRVLLLDPMLATGGTAEMAIDRLQEAGAQDLVLLAVVAAPEGVARLERRFPGLRIQAAALDRGLDPQKYIVPGLGDFGDRLYGT